MESVTLDSNSIGQQIMIHRKSEGLTQVKLGDRVAVSETTIYRYEHGKTAVPSDILARIAKVLHKDLNQFLPPGEAAARAQFTDAGANAVNPNPGSEDLIERELGMLIHHIQVIWGKKKQNGLTLEEAASELSVLEAHVHHIILDLAKTEQQN